jgi:hypothetical protein
LTAATNPKGKNMSPIIAKDNSETKFAKLPLPEAGTVQAVCCAVWDLGNQKTSYMGKERIQHKIIIAWEISQTIDAPDSEYHGKPYMLTRKYTLSMGELSNLRKDLEAWRGKPFTAEEVRNGVDLEKLYGVNCYIGIKHEPDRNDASKVYANVTAILPLPKGVQSIKPVRAHDEAPPKWVIEKQAQAVNVPQTADEFYGVPPEEDNAQF